MTDNTKEAALSFLISRVVMSEDEFQTSVFVTVNDDCEYLEQWQSENRNEATRSGDRECKAHAMVNNMDICAEVYRWAESMPGKGALAKVKALSRAVHDAWEQKYA